MSLRLIFFNRLLNIDCFSILLQLIINFYASHFFLKLIHSLLFFYLTSLLLTYHRLLHSCILLSSIEIFALLSLSFWNSTIDKLINLHLLFKFSVHHIVLVIHSSLLHFTLKIWESLVVSVHSFIIFRVVYLVLLLHFIFWLLIK